MPTVDTGVICPYCKKGSIVAEIDNTCSVPPEKQICGPGGRKQREISIRNFHCNNCDKIFKHPPGKPEMGNEIIQKLQNPLYYPTIQPLKLPQGQTDEIQNSTQRETNDNPKLPDLTALRTDVNSQP